MTEEPNIITVRIEFYHGVGQIAAFLRLNEKTCYRKLQAGKIPAKKDEKGQWVLSNRDYYESFQR